MWGQQFTSLLLVLGLTNLSHALPGLRAHNCRDMINGVDKDSCGNALLTISDSATTTSTSDVPSSITSSPSIVVQAHRRSAQSITVVCDIHECTFYDVSSSLVTVVTLPAVTAAPRPPFANGTETSQPHAGPTGTGTGVVSGTGISETSSAELNGTTTITSRMTKTTFKAGSWSDWTSAAAGTGTGRQPHNSANATNSNNPISASHWSVSQWSAWSTPTGSSHASPTLTNSTYVSAGRTHTKAPQSPSSSSCSSDESSCLASTTSVSYKTTETYVFAESTVILPIPDSFETSTSHSTKTHTSKHTSTSSYSTSLVGGSISTSSCWTTTVKSTSVTGNHKHTTMTVPTQICWILSCDEDDHCTDHISRYPMTVDAVPTSSMSDMDTTAMATTTMSSHSSGATMTSSSGHDTMWMTWSASANSTTTSPSSHSTSPSSTRSTTRANTRSVDATSAFESTYPAWLSWTSTTDTMTTRSFTSNDPIAHSSISVAHRMIPTLSPLSPGAAVETGLNAAYAMMNRKRYLMVQKHRGGVEQEGEVGIEIEMNENGM